MTPGYMKLNRSCYSLIRPLNHILDPTGASTDRKYITGHNTFYGQFIRTVVIFSYKSTLKHLEHHTFVLYIFSEKTK